MADLTDYTGKNRRFTGTIGVDISSGTTGQRDTTFGGGTLRFNSTTNLLEYYTGTDWKPIDSPPLITGFTINNVGGSSVTSANINIDTPDDTTATIEVLGSLFDTTGATVQFEAEGSGTTVNTQTLTRNSANKLTCTVNVTDFTEAGDPYNIKVTNGSGLSAQLASAFDVNAAPAFTNAADTTYIMYDSARGSGIAAADLCGATDPDGDSTLTYSVTTGSLPSGLSITSGTGAITGTASAVSSDETTTFSVTVTDDNSNSNTRQFKITVKAPQITTYTSGTGNYSVPSGVSTLDVLVIGSGGPGGSRSGGGGGAGGMVDRAAFPVTPGGTLAYSVGGQGPQPAASTAPTRGSNSTFGTLTALAGGAGQMDTQGQVNGGSGGGRHYDQAPTGTAQQPTQPGDSGTYGHGNPGGRGSQGPHHAGGGGGGAGSAGGNASPVNAQGAGGQGRVSNVSGSPVTYAGGGGAGGHPNAGPGGAGGPGGGGSSNPGGNQTGNNATANRGSGGGGAFQASAGGRGGSGIIIVSY